VSPTIFREDPFRFYFFPVKSLACMCTCMQRPEKAKSRLEPRIKLAQNYGLSMRQVNAALRLIQEHEDDIRKAWKTHFGR